MLRGYLAFARGGRNRGRKLAELQYLMDVPDATCTRTRLWFSVVLLAIGAGYTLTGIGYIDTTGACHAGLTSREAKPDKKVTSLS